MNLSRGSGGTPGGLPAAAPPYIVYVPLGPRPSPHRHPPKSEARTTTGLVRRVCEEGPCRSTDTAPLAFPCAGAHKRRAPKGPLLVLDTLQRHAAPHTTKLNWAAPCTW